MRARDAGSTATAPPAVSLDAELVDVDGVTPGSDARVRVTASLAPDASRAAQLAFVAPDKEGLKLFAPGYQNRKRKDDQTEFWESYFKFKNSTKPQ